MAVDKRALAQPLPCFLGLRHRLVLGRVAVKTLHRRMLAIDDKAGLSAVVKFLDGLELHLGMAGGTVA